MPKILGIGPHYHSLLASKGLAPDYKPHLFIKPFTSLLQPGGDIILPASAERVLAEVEVAIRINRTLRNVTVEQLEEETAISGYAIANDLTAFGSGVMGEGKIYDTFTPIGHFVQVAEPQSLQIESLRNGEVQQSSNTSEMGYSFNQIISYFSSILTIEEGDILLTGTPAGPFQLFPGDQIEIRSAQLGSIVNRVRSEKGE